MWCIYVRASHVYNMLGIHKGQLIDIGLVLCGFKECTARRALLIKFINAHLRI